MILHTKLYSLMIFLLFSCNSNDKKIKATTISNDTLKIDAISSTKNQRNDQNNISQTVWDSYAYEVDNRYKSEYGEDYAKEFTKFSSLTLKNDSIFMGDCKEKIYQYNYPTKAKKYENESIFITFYKPKTDSIKFISTQSFLKDQSCIPLDNVIIYYENPDELVIHDRGYFFKYHKRISEQKEKINIRDIKGLPGNNRSGWFINTTINDINTIQNGLKYFSNVFPYGAKGLIQSIPNDMNYKDSSNNITYKYSNNILTINKADPMGEITIILEVKNNKMKLNYKMELPDYD